MKISYRKGIKMNRRTFLQTMGAAIALPTVPCIAQTPKSEWISLSHKRPQIGQYIIVKFSFHENDNVIIKGSKFYFKQFLAK